MDSSSQQQAQQSNANGSNSSATSSAVPHHDVSPHTTNSHPSTASASHGGIRAVGTGVAVGTTSDGNAIPSNTNANANTAASSSGAHAPHAGYGEQQQQPTQYQQQYAVSRGIKHPFQQQQQGQGQVQQQPQNYAQVQPQPAGHAPPPVPAAPVMTHHNYGRPPSLSSAHSTPAPAIQPTPPQQQQPAQQPQHSQAAPVSRSWSVPNPLSMIPPPSSSGGSSGGDGSSGIPSGGAVAARAPNPLASLTTNASSNQSRAALAAHARAAHHQQQNVATHHPQQQQQQIHHRQPQPQAQPQQRTSPVPAHPLSPTRPPGQPVQHHHQGQPMSSVPHPLAQQQQQQESQVRAVQHQQQQARAAQQQQYAQQQHAQAQQQQAQQQQAQQQQAQQQHAQRQQAQQQQQQQYAQQPRVQQQHPQYAAPPHQHHQHAQPPQQRVVPQQSSAPHHQQSHPHRPQAPGQPQQQPVRRPKVVLSEDAKRALAKAIWSALRSPTGQPHEEAVRAAEAHGLPRHAILNAAKVARHRELAKKQAAAAAAREAAKVNAIVSRGDVVRSFPQPQAAARPETQATASSSQPHYHQQQHHAPPPQQQQHQHRAHAPTAPTSHAHPSSATTSSSSSYYQPQEQHRQPQTQNPVHPGTRPTSAVHSAQPTPAQPKEQPPPAQPSRPLSRPPSKTVSSAPPAAAAATTSSTTTAQEPAPAPAPAPPAKPPVPNPWTRLQSGTLLIQKGRFLAVANSMNAYSSSTSECKTLVASRKLKAAKKTLGGDISAETLRAARLLQEKLRKQKQQVSSKKKQPSSSKGSKREQLLDPQKFRRVKVETKRHAKAFDRAAKKVRQVTAEAMIKSHKEWSKTLLSHQSEFLKFHKNRKMEIARVAKSCRDRLDKEGKQKEKDAAAAERARLAALKSNDMSAYTKLLEETKNDRLKFLMDKTEESFTQISTLLHERGGGHGNTVAGKNEKKKESSSYYEKAHFKSEEVRQPSILVGGDLKEYQLAGLQWLVSLYNNKLNGILADEMGLGKTIQAISLIGYLMEYKHNLGPYLVIVPLSTLSNWQNEFVKWCPSARLVCYKGTPAVRKDIYKDEVSKGHFNVLLTTYEYIIKDKKFLRKIDWTYAIVDEGHRMKNAQSKFAVTLGTHYNTEYRVLLTGTPLMNQLSELWSLLNFLLPSVFNSVETFDQWFSRPFSQFGSSGANANAEKESEVDLLTNEERMLIIHRLHELLRPFMLRRVKSEVLDQLPEKVEKVLRCELSSWQKELYKQISVKTLEQNNLLNDGFVQQQNTPSRGLNNVVMQLRKVCNHPMLFSPEGYQINDTIIRSSAKVALLDQMLPKLKAAGHRVLIFTQMTQVMTILEDYFALRGYLSLRLDGSTPAEEREKRMYRFNSPDSPYFIFLLSTRAGGLGLNLTAADTVVIFDSDWNPMMDLQAQDRAHRIGQRSDVSVFRLITNSPVEEKILSRATEKLNTAALVVEAGKFNKGSVESDNSLERKQLMEILLTDFDSSNAAATPKGPSEKSGGSDFGDDDDDNSAGSEKEDLNELLSNNETDFNMYAAYDEKRTRDGIGLTELYTSPEDVPDWIKYPGGKKKKNNGSSNDGFEEGSRKRKEVSYDDGLTEKQFLRMMDKQLIAEEKEAKSRKKARRGPKPKGSNVDAEEEDDDEEEELEAVNTESDLTDWTFRRLISCCKTVTNLKDPGTKRRLADLFLEKPAPQQFPDYYELIEKPIAINDILRKLRGKLYNTFKEMRDDWKLMVANAIKFNGEDSWVVLDAQALEKELDRVCKRNGFSEDKLPSPKKKPPKKKLRIKLSLKAAAKNDSDDAGDEDPPEPEPAPPPKKKRGRKPKKKTA